MLTRLTTTLILQYIPIMAYVNYYASIKKKKLGKSCKDSRGERVEDFETHIKGPGL